MKACVLCPGPSLSEVAGRPFRDEYDLVIGVNRAAEIIACDYWVALDTRTFGMTRVAGHPVIVTAPSHFQRMCLTWPEARSFESIAPTALDVRKLPRCWSSKGLLTAIVVAHTRGAKTISCFGVDWSGARDYDGKTFRGQVRTQKRWEDEAKQFAKLSRALAASGVVVARVRPEMQSSCGPSPS